MSCWMAACVNTKAFEFWSKGILLYWGPNHWVLWTIKRNFKGKFILWWEPMKCLYCTGVKCNLKELIVKLMIWRPWSSLKSELFPQQSLVCKLTSLYKTCLIWASTTFKSIYMAHNKRKYNSCQVVCCAFVTCLFVTIRIQKTVSIQVGRRVDEPGTKGDGCLSLTVT